MNPHETFLRNPLNITQYRHDKEALRTTCIKNVKLNNDRLLVGSLLYSETETGPHKTFDLAAGWT